MCQGEIDIYPGDVTGCEAWRSAETCMAPSLCTVERSDLLMVVKISGLNLSTSERWVAIKSILDKRTPVLWKLSHLPEATQ